MTKPATALTDKQQRVFNFVRSCITARGEAPTIAEICARFNLRSSASAHTYLVKFEKAGLIKRTANVQRGITLCDNNEGNHDETR